MSDVTLVENGGAKTAPAVSPDKAAAEKTAVKADGAKAADKSVSATGKVTEQPKADAAKTLTEIDALDADEKAVVAGWPDDWRERLAGNDEAALKQLKRFNGIDGLFKKLQNQDKVIRETRKTTARPGKDATPEEIAEYRKANNVPEQPEGYLEGLKLADGKVLGDDDKPIFNDFAKVMHDAHVPPEHVAKTVDWYLGRMEQIATAQAEQDNAFRVETRDALRDEWGAGDFKRNVNGARALFKDVPEEVYKGLMHARTPDGRLVGDHPVYIKLWSSLVSRIPELQAATIVSSSGGDAGKTIDTEIKDIEKTMRTDRRAYDKDNAMQARYRELLDARQRLKKSKAA